ncbi:MAG: diguanylate cyclase [bacterium]
MDNYPVKVLLVDDDEDYYLIIGDLLKEIGPDRYFLEWADSYKKGRGAVCRSSQYDVCLIDYCLGEHNGLDLLREGVAAGCKFPLILLTGLGDSEVDLDAMKAGAADYLEKGVLSPPLLERSLRYAIEHKQTLEALRESEERLKVEAAYDSLTGLLNRRYLIKRLISSVHSARRHGSPLSVCLCDLDGLKSINDGCGHLTGDDVLAEFGKLMTEELRSEDIVGRFGGDEFCIIFPYISASEAAVSVDRIRRRLESRTFGKKDKACIATVSFGIADLGPGMTENDLLKAADDLLYQAKRSGSNRIVLNNNKTCKDNK